MEHELFQSFCNAMPLGVCLVDREGKIVYWNAAAEGITGYHSHEVLGRRLPRGPARGSQRYCSRRLVGMSRPRGAARRTGSCGRPLSSS